MSTPSGFAATDVQGMAQAQEAMQTIHGQLGGALQALTEQQATLAANWSGEASSTFGQALANFIQDFETINNALVNMMETMSQNTNIYVNTNDASTAVAQAFVNNTSGMLTPASLSGAIPGGLKGF
jgi:WXG100 family type VII secretion target